MLFNYDLFELGAIAFIVSGLLIQSFYISGLIGDQAEAAPSNNESLINTNSLSNLDSNVQLNNLSNQSYVEASVQTTNIQIEAGIQTSNTYVNTGMQTSSRMWLESVRNWITDILGNGSAAPQPNYVDVGVQTGTRSSWELFKESFNNFFNLESSSSTISTPTNVRVNTWIE